MSGPKPGDTVRVSYEGVMQSEHLDPEFLNIKTPDGKRSTFHVGPESNAKVEVIRTAYVDGGIYMDADCDVFRHTTTGFEGGPGWFLFSRMDREWGGVVRPVTWPTHPLERLDGTISERQGNG